MSAALRQKEVDVTELQSTDILIDESTPGDVINQYNMDFQFPDSDITVISSDGLRFKVHRYQLQAASSVFRNMLAIGNTVDAEFHLIDPIIETGWILNPFFRLIYAERFEIQAESILRRYIKLVDFLRKYDCKSAFKSLSYFLQSVAGQVPNESLEIFVVASHMDDKAVASAAIRQCSGTIWGEIQEEDNTSPLERCVPGKAEFDISSMPLSYLENISPKYLSALLRATAKCAPQSQAVPTDWKSVAVEFERLLVAHEAAKVSKSKEKSGKRKRSSITT